MRKLIALTLLFTWAGLQAAPADDVACSQCVDKRDLAPDAVSTGKLVNEAVTRDKIASRAVNSDKLKGGSVTQGKIKDAAVTANKIRAGAVTADKLSPELGAAIAKIDALEDYIEQLQAYIEIDETSNPTHPTVRIVAANLQIVNGAGTTQANGNGTGNLIVGYDEAATLVGHCSDGEHLDQTDCSNAGRTWATTSFKTGSHNIVVGRGHSYPQSATLLAGEFNIANRDGASVTGGTSNIAAGPWASISGGSENQATATEATVTGGAANLASGFRSSVSGGAANVASGDYSSVSGGGANAASGNYSSVSGGQFGEAGHVNSTIGGGSRPATVDGWDIVDGTTRVDF